VNAQKFILSFSHKILDICEYKMLFFHGKEARNQAKEHKGLILFSSANTSACGQWKHAPIFVFLVDRMRQNRYNTPRMPRQYGISFINCGSRRKIFSPPAVE